MKIIHSKRLNRSVGSSALAFLFLLLLGSFTALPIYYAIINAFKPLSELFLFPPRFVVYNPTMQNFINIMRVQAQAMVPFERYIFNSVFVTTAGTAIYLLIASMAAFPLAKHSFPGKKAIQNLIVFSILFRPEVTDLPQYILLSKTGMIDTYIALILPTLGTSFGVYLIMQFISSFPNDVLEAARIDGTSETGAFFRIVFPAIKPAWLTLIIFTFIGLWNQSGEQFTYQENMKLLPTMMLQLNSGGIIRTGVVAAVAVLLMLPTVIIFLFCQNNVVETMAHSGIKS